MKMTYSKEQTASHLTISLTATTAEDLFTYAAQSLFDCLDARKRRPRASDCPTRIIRLTALDQESLLAEWLTALVNLHYTHKENYFTITIRQLSTTTLDATVHGIPAKQDALPRLTLTPHQTAITKKGAEYTATLHYTIG